MKMSQPLAAKGFAFSAVEPEDWEDYFAVRKRCYASYVIQYFGGWDEEDQRRRNASIFALDQDRTCFQKILLNGETVGFFGYDELEDRIDGMTIQMLATARDQGIGSLILSHIVRLSEETGKPAFLQVFRSNRAQALYQRFGFVVYDETPSHYRMRYDPKDN